MANKRLSPDDIAVANVLDRNVMAARQILLDFLTGRSKDLGLDPTKVTFNPQTAEFEPIPDLPAPPSLNRKKGKK